MKIGTPLTANAIRVMLLGSGELGKEVIIAFQRLGVEVIAVDRYANAPGHQVAHRAHVIDMANAEALRALIEQEQPDYIVPEIEAIATEVLLEVEQHGHSTVIPTAQATNLTMNREGIRRLAAEELGLLTSRYGFADSLNALQVVVDGGIGYPCIIKPVMSSSGKGQSYVNSPEELKAAWAYAQSGARVDNGQVIAEEVIEFDFEITLLTVRARGQSGHIETHFCEPIGHIQEQGDYIESWQPQPLSATAWRLSKEMALQVTQRLGGQGLFGVELFITGDRVCFSEVSPRPHDTGMVTLVSQHQNEFELHARAILGLPVDVNMRSPGASAVIYGGLEKQGIAFEGVVEALSVPGSDLRLFGKPESYIKRRMGVALAYGKNITEARDRAKSVASKIKPVAN
ncbi:MAG: formate-dependent phosphoribosylglycinamide formyltransferase [Gammaproteobacteria bacterium]|nr:formate-dependent phosphoribosylglycinamide formyltransferase [Gammaproteobacteria bacterium]